MNTGSMMIISSKYDDKETFKMIPTDRNCPYAECIFDSTTKTLIVLGTIKNEGYSFLPKLDSNGRIQPIKGKVQEGESPYAQQRVLRNSFMEYYVTEESDIHEFINAHAYNAEKSDYKKFFIVEEEPLVETIEAEVEPAE